MSEVEYLLKISAVDCNLNIHGNKFETDIDFQENVTIKNVILSVNRMLV